MGSVVVFVIVHVEILIEPLTTLKAMSHWQVKHESASHGVRHGQKSGRANTEYIVNKNYIVYKNYSINKLEKILLNNKIVLVLIVKVL